MGEGKEGSLCFFASKMDIKESLHLLLQAAQPFAVEIGQFKVAQRADPVCLCVPVRGNRCSIFDSMEPGVLLEEKKRRDGSYSYLVRIDGHFSCELE